MTGLTKLFNSVIAQKTLLTCSVVLGTSGLLSGAWLAAYGQEGANAGIYGGGTCLTIGIAGLVALKRKRTIS